MQIDTFSIKGRKTHATAEHLATELFVSVCSILPLQPIMFLLWMLRDPVPNVTQQLPLYL